MSVHVIEAPNPPAPLRSRCKCGALLEFDRTDVRHQFSRPGEDIGSVTCPHCKADHYLDLATASPVRTCADCGRREDNHNVRHPFVATGPAPRPGTCTYCGLPSESAACQRSHP